MKNYSIITAIVLCMATVQTTQSVLKNFYVSNSPYFTTGYLGAQLNRQYRRVGPNPYAPVETRSSGNKQQNMLPNITHWRKKRIENPDDRRAQS